MGKSGKSVLYLVDAVKIHCRWQHNEGNKNKVLCLGGRFQSLKVKKCGRKKGRNRQIK
jgi:hypothetical protein